MSYKQNFIKRDRVDSDEIPTIKDTYDRISEKRFPNKTLRKNEPFVLMFRNFIFFDVKSYECRNGDLYIRNVVDGVVLKRYFRMDSDDQLTVFKNREEFDIFMKKQKEQEYFKGDGVGVEDIVDTWEICDGNFSCRIIKSKVTGQYVLEDSEPMLVRKVYDVLDNYDYSQNKHMDLKTCSSKIENIIERGSEEFILDNFSGIRNSETGKIDVITSTWDGTSVIRDECPDFFDEVVKVLETNVGSAQILTKKDFK